MKRGGPQHPKTQRLALALDLPIYAAVGLLEMLWHFTAQYAPAGDLGKFSDQEIETHLRWQGPPSSLVPALVAARLVDPHPTHRLVVHDWHDHADQAVQRVLSRRGESFVTNEKKKRKPSSRRLASELAAASLARGNGNGIGNGSGNGGGESERGPEPVAVAPVDEFDRWYAAYPKKRKPEDARKAWEATAKKRPPLDTMLAALMRQRGSVEWQKDGGQFVPYPASYLRAHSWADDLGEPAKAVVALIQRPPPKESVLDRYRREGVL